MSFDYPQKNPRPKKGGINGIVVILFICFIAYFFLSGRGNVSGPGSGSESVEKGDRQVERRIDPRIDRELEEADEYRRQRAEVLGSSEPATRKEMPTGSPTGGSEWSIEDVNAEKKVSGKASKTVGKDGWSIEEVPTGKRSGTGFEANRSGDKKNVDLTERSDWSVEDVEPKSKKTKEGDWSLEEVEKGGKK